MSYKNDNLSLIRSNSISTAYSSGDITENTVDSYANLFYPHILDNGGNTNIISLTIDIFNEDDLEKNTIDLPNKNWIDESRLRNGLIYSQDIWGFKEAYHANKKSRAVSNAFCFCGQQLTFYIAPQGHGTGGIDDEWIYCKTSIVVTSVDIINGTETTLKTFDDFEVSDGDSSRYFTWTVPDKDDTTFANYSLYGLSVIRLDVTKTYYEDANMEVPYTNDAPNVNQSCLQVLTYSGAKEIIEVDMGNANIVNTVPGYDDDLEDIFAKTKFAGLESLNQNTLTDSQKRAMMADQIAAIFISQHPVVTADCYPAKVIGFGVNEATLPRKVVSRAITYGRRYPEIIPLVKDRLFGMIAAYQAYDFVVDFKKFVSNDYQQSSQVVRDPVRTILIDSDDFVTDDLGIDGLIFDPYALTVMNAEFVSRVDEPLVIEVPLHENLVDIENIAITNEDDEVIPPYSDNVKIAFDVVYGTSDINQIRYSVFTKNSLNYRTYLDNAGTSRSHIFRFDDNNLVNIYPVKLGEIVNAQIDIEDIQGGVTSFFATQLVQGYGDRPGLVDLRIYQRNDGSGMVDVYYTYVGVSEINNSYVYVQFSVDGGENWSEVPINSLKGDFGNNVMPGRRRVSWQPEVDLEAITVGEPVLCRITLYDTDNNSIIGDKLTGALVYDITKPIAAVRRITIEEELEMIQSSSSSDVYSSSSSSSSFGESSSSSSSSELYSSSSSSSSELYSSSSSSSSELYSSSSSSSSSSELYSSSSSSSSELYSSSSSSSSSSSVLYSSSSSSSVLYSSSSSSSELYSSSSSSSELYSSSSSSELYSSSSSSSGLYSSSSSSSSFGWGDEYYLYLFEG